MANHHLTTQSYPQALTEGADQAPALLHSSKAPADSAGSSRLSRRQMLTTIASASVASVIARPAPAAAINNESNGLHQLWSERVELISQSRQNTKRLMAAYDELPAWAQSGPEHIDWEGNKSGADVGWPEMKEYTLPSGPGIYRRIRPSPRSIKRDLEVQLLHCPTSSEKLEAVFQERMRVFRARRRQQRAEERKLGIDKMEKESQRLMEEIFEIEHRIGAELSQNRGCDALIAKMAIEVGYNAALEDEAVKECGGIVEVVCDTLRVLRKDLTGPFAKMADFVAAHPNVSFKAMDKELTLCA